MYIYVYIYAYICVHIHTYHQNNIHAPSCGEFFRMPVDLCFKSSSLIDHAPILMCPAPPSAAMAASKALRCDCVSRSVCLGVTLQGARVCIL